MFQLRDEDDDAPMGLGLPSFASGGKEAKHETKQTRGSSVFDDDDDDDIVMSAGRDKKSVKEPPREEHPNTGDRDPFESTRRVALASLARHARYSSPDFGETKTASKSVVLASAAHAPPKPMKPTTQCRVVEEKNSREPEVAVLFVIDSTNGAGKEQLELVNSLIYGQALNAVVINRGLQDLHVIGFNTRLTCTACAKVITPRFQTEVRRGVAGSGVFRGRTAVCDACGKSRLSDSVLNDGDLGHDAKNHAQAIQNAITTSVMVPSRERRCRLDTSWKAATAVLQDLSHSVQNGPDTFQPVRKVVVLCSRDPSIRDQQLLLTMPYRVDGGCLELVPVIPVLFETAAAKSRTTDESLMRPFSVHDAVVSVDEARVSESVLEVRERIESYARKSKVCVAVGADSNQYRWLRPRGFAPVLLLPWFSIIMFCQGTAEEHMPQLASCDLPGVGDELKVRYQQDPDTDEDAETVDYRCLDKRMFHTSVAIELGRRSDDDGGAAAEGKRGTDSTNKDVDKTARSKDITEEGERRGAKRLKVHRGDPRGSV